MLSRPLRDRFGIPLQLEFYSPENLKEIITLNAKKLSILIEDSAAFEVAQDPEEHLELQLGFLKRIVDFSVVEDSSHIGINTVLKSLEQMRIDNEGLDEMDRKYLRCISNDYNGGPVGVETLSAALLEQQI